MSSIFIWFLILVPLVMGAFFWNNKIIFRFDTLFRKGFKKNRDNYGIYCWVGKQGDGKTYSVCDYLSEMKGYKIISNVKSYCDNHKGLALYEESFYDIIRKFTNGTYDNKYIIFYDELFSLLQKGKLDQNILNFISQLRKRQIYLVTTVQEWLEVNVTFRRYVRYEIDCKMLNIPLFGAFSINKIKDGYQMKWDNLENDYVAPIIKTTIKKCSKAIADSYDTFETIKIH